MPQNSHFLTQYTGYVLLPVSRIPKHPSNTGAGPSTAAGMQPPSSALHQPPGTE